MYSADMSLPSFLLLGGLADIEALSLLGERSLLGDRLGDLEWSCAKGDLFLGGDPFLKSLSDVPKGERLENVERKYDQWDLSGLIYMIV